MAIDYAATHRACRPARSGEGAMTLIALALVLALVLIAIDCRAGRGSDRLTHRRQDAPAGTPILY